MARLRDHNRHARSPASLRVPPSQSLQIAPSATEAIRRVSPGPRSPPANLKGLARGPVAPVRIKRVAGILTPAHHRTDPTPAGTTA